MAIRGLGVLIMTTVVLVGCQRADKQVTLQSCADLLPKGDLYMLEIRSVIDTGTKPPTLEGGFEIASESAEEAQLQAFSKCMREVILPKGGEPDADVTTSTDSGG